MATFKPGQLFDPATVTAEQMAGLSNIPGQSLSQTNTPQQIQAAQNLSQGNIQGTLNPQTPTVTGAVPGPLTAPGSNTNFYNAVSTFVTKANENKVLVDQKNLMLKQLFDSPLTSEEKAKLPASVQMDIESGNSDLLKLNVSLINDQLQGRVNQTLTATKYLLQGYKDDQAAADKRMQESRDALINQLQIGGSSAFANLSPAGKRQMEKELGFANGFLDQKTVEERRLDLDYLKATGTDTKSEIKEINGKDSVVTYQNGQIVSIEPITSTTPTAGPEQLAQYKSQVEQISGIISSGNLKTKVGPNIFSRFGNWRDVVTPGAANFIADVEQLRSQLTLEALITAKANGATFGALSEGEMRILEASASKLGTWAKKDGDGNVKYYDTTEKAFKAELDKINNFAKLDYVLKGGNPTDVGIKQMPDGTWLSPNSDGTFEDLTDEIKSREDFSSAGNASASKIAAAIKKVESNGNYNAKGGSGEFGAYQFMPSTWKSWAGQYLGNSNAPMTQANQDKVATAKINDLLEQGYNAQQVALIWNGGQPKVKKGTNKYGVAYDSGAYAQKVLKALT